MDDDVGHVWLAVTDIVFEDAGEVMGLREANLPVRRDGDEDHESGLGVQEAKVRGG